MALFEMYFSLSGCEQLDIGTTWMVFLEIVALDTEGSMDTQPVVTEGLGAFCMVGASRQGAPIPQYSDL